MALAVTLTLISSILVKMSLRPSFAARFVGVNSWLFLMLVSAFLIGWFDAYKNMSLEECNTIISSIFDAVIEYSVKFNTSAKKRYSIHLIENLTICKFGYLIMILLF